MMLSRAATDMYWTARYLERAASMLRLLEVSYLLDLDRQEGSPPQWEPLIWITGDMALFRSLYPEASPWNVMRFLVLDVDYPNSVVACLEKARANTKGLREELPAPLWTEINRQGTALVKAATQEGISHSRVLRLCRETNRTHMLILGMVSETMAHDEAYRLWQLGTYIERADKTSRLLHVKYFHLLPKLSHVGTIVDDAHWGALLQSLEAREEYHRRYGAIMPDKVIDMLVRCPDFARSIAFCLDELRDNLSAMPGDGKRKAIDLLELLRFRVSTLSGADIIAFGVHEFINELQIQMNHISDAVIAAICPVVPSKPAKEEKK